MTLRRKTLLIVTLILAILVVILYLILHTLLMDSFSTLEQQVTLRDLNRAEISFQDRATRMEQAIHDWSTWDDAYHFIQDRNNAFIDNNLGDSTFTSLDINLMLFVNDANEIVYSKAVALETDWPNGLLPQIENYARNDISFLHLMSSAPTAGLIVIDEEPLLMASRPVLHSDESGPEAGTLIWGHYLGQQELLELSQLLRLSIDLRPLNTSNLPTEDQTAQTTLSITSPRIIIPVNETTIHGYALLNNIYGQPALILRTTQDRAIYEQGQASLIYFMAALTLVGIVFAALVLLLLERLILAPLGRLNRHVRQIGVNDDFSILLPVDGHDEFAQLAATLNTMLNLIAQSRSALQRERNLLRLLIDTVPANVYIKDSQSRFVEANVATALQMGVKTPGDLVGKTDFDFFNTELAEKYLTNEQAILQSGQPMRNIEERSFDHITQRENWLLTTEVPIIDEKGQITGVVGVSLDITEHKLAQEQIAQERDLLRTLIDQLPDYIFIKDADGRFVNSNRAHNHIAQVKKTEELRGKTAFDVFPPHLAAQFDADDRQVLETGQALVNIERTSVNAQGLERTMLTTKVPLRDVSGKVSGLVGISRDITERKLAEQQALELRNERERVQVLHQFIGDATHDLMTPIAIINTSTDLARRAPNHERLVTHLDKIEILSETLQDRLQDMLTMSQLDMMTEADLELRSVDLRQLLRALVETFRSRAEAKAQQLSAEFDFEAITLHVDDLYLRMALGKIIENAIHFTDNGGTIYISVARRDSQIAIAIRDTGIGIADADLRHIFERFYRAQTHRPLDSGAGLGLSITQRIIDLHCGSIEVTSTVGSGSTFIVLLPIS